MTMENSSKIEDTYAEGFKGFYSRIIVTADDEETLRSAAHDATSTPATVIGRIEGGIEKWLDKSETPDGRQGAVLQFWGGGEPDEDSLENFEKEMSYRIRQDILVKPFTSVFDGSNNPDGRLNMMDRVGHCGDGYEWVEERYGRDMIVVPIMVPDFEIENYLGYSKGVSGGNFWYFCSSKDAVIKAGRKAKEAIREVDGAITPFGIVSAGSKTETNYPEIGPTTNHPFCPSLRDELGGSSKVPEGIEYIPEIVINARSMRECKRAMKVGIETVLEFNGVEKVSAGNYDGNLGSYEIYLKELF